jgi:hypothetical protein
MKSIKTNPNSAKGPDKGKIVNKLYCMLLTTLELKFIILVSNLIYTVNSFGKAFGHVQNCLLKKKHMAQTKTLTDSTRKRHKKEDSASFV